MTLQVGYYVFGVTLPRLVFPSKQVSLGYSVLSFAVRTVQRDTVTARGASMKKETLLLQSYSTSELPSSNKEGPNSLPSSAFSIDVT